MSSVLLYLDLSESKLSEYPEYFCTNFSGSICKHIVWVEVKNKYCTPSQSHLPKIITDTLKK